jgi:hypothetical protein
VGNDLDALEDEVMGKPTHATLERIHGVRRQLLQLHRLQWRQRDAIATLWRDEAFPICDAVRVFLRDVHDHAFEVLDTIETFRDLSVGLMDVYLSQASNRMNEVMTTLTLVSTVFIPLTFIAGVYGMNFKGERSPLNMPELEWYFGYPFALGLMATVTLMIVWWFRRRGWIGDGRRRQGAWLEEGSGDGADAGREAGALAIVPPPVHAGLVAAPAARGPASRIAISRPGPRGPRSAAERADQAAPASLAPRPPRARG